MKRLSILKIAIKFQDGDHVIAKLTLHIGEKSSFAMDPKLGA